MQGKERLSCSNLLLVRVIAVLSLLPSFYGYPCPKRCTCYKTNLECRGVKTVPNNVSTDIQRIDLSDSPSLQVEASSFVCFKNLYALRLANCNLSRPFLLPENLKELDLQDNSLTYAAVEEILNAGNSSLEQVILNDNRLVLNVGDPFSIFPMSVTRLVLSRNVLHEIRNGDFNNLPNIEELDLSNTKLRYIAKGAFDSSRSLKTVTLRENELSVLPGRLFANTKVAKLDFTNNKLTRLPDLSGLSWVATLDLTSNSIQHVNGSALKIEFVANFYLAYNKIETFALENVEVLTLDLSHNRIQKLENHSFGRTKSLSTLSLQANYISVIEANAFMGVTFVNYLHLQRNKLARLPKGTFSGMNVRALFLFDNQLSGMDGVLDGMKSLPKILLLFGNNNLSYLRSSDFLGMGSDAKIYINCRRLRGISNSYPLQASIMCSPSSDLEIPVKTSLNVKGFHCEGDPKQTEEIICRPCLPGHYGALDYKTRKESCVACPAGSFYQDEMAAIACKSCSNGQYVSPEKAPGKSPLQCLTCPKGTNSNGSAGFRACRCLNGYARDYRFGPCKKCTQVGYTCERDYPELKRGFWITWHGMNASSKQTCKDMYERFASNLRTENDFYDRRTSHFSCNMPIAMKCPIGESCQGGEGANCSAGYTGVLCAVCDYNKGYMKHLKSCVKCPSPFIAILQCAMFLLLFVLICWLMSALDKVPLAANDFCMEDTRRRTFADLIQSSLKILMGFYQVLLSVIHAFAGIHWPRLMSDAVTWFEYAQFSVVKVPSLHCIKPNWRMNAISEFWLSIITTIALPLLISLLFCARIVLFSGRPSGGIFKERCHRSCKNCLQSVLFFLLATYPMTSTTIFHLLPPSCHTFCTSKVNGRCVQKLSYLRSDYSVPCLTSSSTSSFDVKLSYAALLLPLGIPCLFLFLLWKFAPKECRNLEPKLEVNSGTHHDSNFVLLAEGRPIGAHKPSIATDALKIGYGNYKAKSWYWEVIEMIRKLLTVMVGNFFLQNFKIGLFGSILTSIIFVLLHARNWPMRNRFDNYMQLLALVSVTVNLCFCAIKASTIQDADIIEPQKDTEYLGIILVFLNSTLLVLIVGRFLKEAILKIVEKISGCTSCCHSCRLYNYREF